MKEELGEQLGVAKRSQAIADFAIVNLEFAEKEARQALFIAWEAVNKILLKLSMPLSFFCGDLNVAEELLVTDVNALRSDDVSSELNYSLELHCRTLFEIISNIENYLYGKKLLARSLITTAQLSFRGLFVFVFTAAAILLFRNLQIGPKPWIGEYFLNQSLSGSVIYSSWESAIDFDWQYAAPVTSIPPDNYSVRWQTCLKLEREAEVDFELRSDDGSRLYIGDLLLMDLWGAHPAESKKARKKLEPGLHLLRVEYHENAANALVSLKANLRDSSHSLLSPWRLIAPVREQGTLRWICK